MNSNYPSKHARKKRRRVARLFKEQDGRCIYCNTKMWLPYDLEDVTISIRGIYPKRTRATLEHKRPVSRNGSRKNLSNQAISCYFCNMRKKNLPHYIFKFVHSNDSLYRFVLKVKGLYLKSRNIIRSRIDT